MKTSDLRRMAESLTAQADLQARRAVFKNYIDNLKGGQWYSQFPVLYLGEKDGLRLTKWSRSFDKSSIEEVTLLKTSFDHELLRPDLEKYAADQIKEATSLVEHASKCSLGSQPAMLEEATNLLGYAADIEEGLPTLRDQPFALMGHPEAFGQCPTLVSLGLGSDRGWKTFDKCSWPESGFLIVESYRGGTVDGKFKKDTPGHRLATAYRLACIAAFEKLAF